MKNSKKVEDTIYAVDIKEGTVEKHSVSEIVKNAKPKEKSGHLSSYKEGNSVEVKGIGLVKVMGVDDDQIRGKALGKNQHGEIINVKISDILRKLSPNEAQELQYQPKEKKVEKPKVEKKPKAEPVEIYKNKEQFKKLIEAGQLFHTRANQKVTEFAGYEKEWKGNGRPYVQMKTEDGKLRMAYIDKLHQYTSVR